MNLNISYNPKWANINTQKSVYEIDTTSEATLITLPKLADFGEVLNGTIIIVDKTGNAGTNNITIQVNPDSTDKIDGANNIVINKNGDIVVITPVDTKNYIALEAINAVVPPPVTPSNKFQAKLYQAVGGELPGQPYMWKNQNFNGAVNPTIIRTGIGQFDIFWEQIAPLFTTYMNPVTGLQTYLGVEVFVNANDMTYQAKAKPVSPTTLRVNVYDPAGNPFDGIMNELSISAEIFTVA